MESKIFDNEKEEGITSNNTHIESFNNQELDVEEYNENSRDFLNDFKGEAVDFNMKEFVDDEGRDSFDANEFKNEDDSSEISLISQESSIDEDIEENYFGKENIFSEGDEESEEAWNDSESEEGLLKSKYKTTPTWINNKRVKLDFEVKIKKPRFYLKPHIFKANNNIRILRTYKNFCMAVDFSNGIYIFKDFTLVRSFNLKSFYINDCVFYMDRIYLTSSREMKELDENYKFTDIKKMFTNNITKMYSSECLYICGDKCIALNSNLNVVGEYYDKITDITEYKGSIFGLNSRGDLLMFNKKLKVEKKIVYDDKFNFYGLFSTFKYLILNTKNGLIFLDENFKYMKETKDNKNKVVGLLEVDDHIAYFTNVIDGVKILDENLRYVNKKVKLPIPKNVSCDKGNVVISSFRDMHLLEIVIE